jgi:ribonuclease HI
VGVLCVNVDAAIFKQENRMGWGAVVRDHAGGLKLACNESINGILSPELAEATAIQRALSVSKDRGFQDIVLVSDCLSMIQRIMSTEKDRSGVGSVVGDIKKLAAEFSTCIFKHSSRRANVAAHLLARRSEASVCNLSFDVVPEYIREVLCNDVN